MVDDRGGKRMTTSKASYLATVRNEGEGRSVRGLGKERWVEYEESEEQETERRRGCCRDHIARPVFCRW